MNILPYEVEVRSPTIFRFASKGPKGTIIKEVVITPVSRLGYYNFGFGDVRSDGSIDDVSETNNDDLLKVFSTIISIMEYFLDRNPDCVLSFKGSTLQRTAVYNMILKRYRSRFSEKYRISGMIMINGEFAEIEYDPFRIGYVVFLVRKK
ncbi:hypothetical protein [Chitinophaga sp. YIM B06452]|uniref:DUF6934 family protein n=1 Tax=Chitinophaga sp. YIM B06452 TaxID=3082158 RepID=UPI0031FF2EDB